MWIKRWWRFAKGEVRFRAEGGLCERFLNLLSDDEKPIRLWDVVMADGVVTASCTAKDYGRIRPFARRTGTRVRSLRYRGAMKTLRPLIRRPGFFVGAVLATAVYLFLAGRIWVVEIATDDPSLREVIAQELRVGGIGVGLPMEQADLDAARMRCIAAVPQIHHVSLYIDGCVVRAAVTPIGNQLSPPDTTPANIVAKRDGLIVSMKVSQGQKTVKVGEAVVAGDLLVCGAIETTEGVLLRHAEAVIMAQTEHRYTVSASRSETVIDSGKMIVCPTVYVFAASLPLYTSGADTAGYTVTREDRPLVLFGTHLPVGVETVTYTEPMARQVHYTEEQVTALAQERLQQTLAQETAGLEVVETHTDGRWVGDTYQLTATVTVIEDIAQEQVLLLGGS